jgi:hypothetical protein
MYMYVNVKAVDFASVSAIYGLNFESGPTVYFVFFTVFFFLSL